MSSSPTPSSTTAVTAASVAAAATAAFAVGVALGWLSRADSAAQPSSPSSCPPTTAFEQLVGSTPLVELRSLSRATGCTVLAKCEFLSPGGSSKDRVALQIVRDAERDGKLLPGATLVEGSSGSTGVALALVARALGYGCCVAMPDDQSTEKAAMLARLGARVERVRPVSAVHGEHYCRVARREAERLAAEHGDARAALFADQFDNASNFAAHATRTGPEILQQAREWLRRNGSGADHFMRSSARCAIDAFVMGAGTGGTLAGVASSLKSHDTSVRAFLVDPPGSSLLNLVRFGVAFAPQQAERALRRHRDDTVVEGVGLDRVTANVARALPLLDGAFSCSDAEAVAMSRFLLRREGLFLGGSSALNCVGAVKAARALGPGHVVVTVLCDRGERYLERLWDDEKLRARGVDVGEGDDDLAFVLAEPLLPAHRSEK